PLGVGDAGALCRVLAGARQPILGGHLGGDRLPAAARSLAAQGLVPDDRLVGTVMSVVLVACFPQDRILFLGALALWGAACSFVSALLRNFASYSAMLAGYTVAIIVGDLLGMTGGVNADQAFLLAVTRASAICIGIVSAGVVLAGADLGGAPRRLAARFADLAAGISSGFSN